MTCGACDRYQVCGDNDDDDDGDNDNDDDSDDDDDKNVDLDKRERERERMRWTVGFCARSLGKSCILSLFIVMTMRTTMVVRTMMIIMVTRIFIVTMTMGDEKMMRVDNKVFKSSIMRMMMMTNLIVTLKLTS